MDEQQDKDFLVEVAYDDAAALNTRDHIQEHYGSHRQSWYRWLSSHLHSRPGMRWLDLGCGPGHLWWRERGWLAAGSDVLLTDLSPGMVAAARHNLAGASHAFGFAVADSESLPFSPRQFDAVVALGLLDHLPRLLESLAEVQRVLQPDGFFYASAGGLRHLQELERLVQPFLPDVTYGGRAAAFGIENGMAQLEPFFRHVAVYIYEDELVFREAEPLVAYVFSEAGVRRRLQGDVFAAFKEHLTGMMAEEGVIRVTRQKGLFAAQL